MRITRLEIFGFKSFMERFVLDFDVPLTGIVGPNGCGKSNIVDALRWVLGETHAKQLRGAVLDDVIFNGSQTRRPLGMAEVSITIRPDDHWVDRLKNPEVVSEIEDSEISEIQANDDEVQKEEQSDSGEELHSTLAGLLDAVPNILESAEIQLTRRLYRSGESEYLINRVPCRLRDMSELYRAIGLGPRGLSIVQQGQIGQIMTKKPVERRQLLEDAAGISGFRVRVEAASRQLARTNANIERLADIISEVEKQVRTLKRQAKRAQERGELKENLKDSDLELFSSKATLVLFDKFTKGTSLKSVSENLESKQRSLLAAQSQETQLRADVEEIDVQLSDLRREKEQLSVEVAEYGNKRNQAKLAKAELEGHYQSVRERLKAIDERKMAIGRDLTLHNEALEQAKNQLLEVQSLKESVSEKIEAKRSSTELLNKINSQRDAVLSDLKELNEKIHSLSVDSASLEAEIAALEKQYAAHRDQIDEQNSGPDQTNFSREIANQRFVKKVDESIDVPVKLRLAVNAALGERASYLIADDINGLAEAFSADGDHSKSVGVVASDVKSSHSKLPEAVVAQIPGISRVVDNININSDSIAAIDSLLGNVFLVSDISQGLKVFELLRANFLELASQITIVTQTGEVVNNWGWYSPAKGNYAAELQPVIEEKTKQLKSIQNDLLALKSSQEVLESNRVELEARKKEIDSLGESEAVHERTLHAEFAKVTSDVARFEEQIRFEENRVNELKEELLSIDVRQNELLEREKQLTSNAVEAESQLGQQDEDIKYEQELMSRQQGILDRILEQESNRDTIKLKLSELLHQIDSLRREQDTLGASIGDMKLAVERCDIELSVLHEDIRQKYGEEIGIPEVSFEQSEEIFDKGQLKQRVEFLAKQSSAFRARLEREGEVDPEVIELYEVESKRLEDMKTQYTDLESARKTLEKTIRKLKDISRTRFVETFGSVKDKFEYLVPRLFGGGGGTMELINPEDPLESGVELIVRPPGKKIRNLDLMSGGEKALAATALLVAMFLHRPSPICVMDEVDAPLDDANLDRFVKLIDEISAKTNFLIITHNKQTMVAMDKLIGITMQEKGISTALKVSFDEAERELEQYAVNQ